MPFFFTENRHLSDRKFGTIFPVPANLPWRYKYYSRKINSITTMAALKVKLGHLLHMGHYDLGLLEAATCPTIATVYDMIPELFPQLFLNPSEIHPNKRELSQGATAVICISHTTKTDLIRLFGIDSAKIFVTHLGINANWAAASTPPKGLPERFILFVGIRHPYKNFIQLFGAMSRLASRYRDLHLVCVGGGGFTLEEKSNFANAGLSERMHQFNATDGELAHCYTNSVAFVFPSLYEGFGLPVLESFVCGCPAILSDRGSLPEVAADAAVYFDPDDEESLDHAIDRVLGDAELRGAVVRRGRLRAADFTPEKTALETAAVYRKVLE
jgi:glycosyltransferase involved in cell wall biosynthesis